MMLKVGLTGGIGSGKSMVARIFEILGAPVYYADEAARRLQNEDPDLRRGIVDIFGEIAYHDGVLDRKYISGIVFRDKGKLEKLNAIVHPATIQDAARWMSRQTAPYTVKEAALIFESGSQRNLDYVIGVTAPEALRIKRTMDRDAISEAEVRKRMERQLPDRIKMRLCDYVLNNDEQQLLMPQVLAIHEKLLELSKASPITD